jgi:hypothetical protein
MLFLDGWEYAQYGVAGSFAADGILGIAASLWLAGLLIYTASRSSDLVIAP